MFQNILVSIDGSAYADQALAEAIDLATANNARLTILTAIPQPPPWAMTPSTASAYPTLAAQFEQESIELMATAVARVPSSVSVTTIISREPVRAAILHQIATGHHDLLVMGSRGRGAVSASLLGSVSHYTLNHCPIPVLIVHKPRPAVQPQSAKALHAVAAA